MIHVETRRGVGILVHRQPGNYTLHTPIGRGATAVVFDATNGLTGERCAVKVIPQVSQKDLTRVNRELTILQSLQHSFIPEFREVMRFGNVTYIVTKYSEGEDLFTIIASGKLIDGHTAKRIFYQILFAVQYLHSHGISHQDIKAENIIVDSAGNVKLIDFGLAKAEDIGGSERGGTLMYLAPELLKAQTYKTQPADIWSLGILLIILTTGRLPYPCAGDRETAKLVAKGRVDYPKEMDGETEALARKMTALNPNDRPTVNDILENPYFTDLRPDQSITCTDDGFPGLETRNCW
jgi:serine/threonine protein kinase